MRSASSGAIPQAGMNRRQYSTAAIARVPGQSALSIVSGSAFLRADSNQTRVVARPARSCAEYQVAASDAPLVKNADRCDLLRLLVMASTHDSIFVQIIFQSRRIERGAGHSNVAYLTMRDRRTPFFQGPHRFAGAVKIP